MSKDKPSYLEQVMEQYCKSPERKQQEPTTGPVTHEEGLADEDLTAPVMVDDETLQQLKPESAPGKAPEENAFAELNPITGPMRPEEVFADEDITATVLIDEDTLERLSAERAQEQAANAENFSEQNPTAIMDVETFKRLRIKEIHEELKGELVLISRYSISQRYDLDIQRGLMQLHAAWAYHERGLIPYSPRELLDESMTGQNIGTKLNQLGALGCQLDWLIDRMTRDSTYRKNIRHIYEKEMPKTEWFQTFKKGSTPQK